MVTVALHCGTAFSLVDFFSSLLLCLLHTTLFLLPAYMRATRCERTRRCIATPSPDAFNDTTQRLQGGTAYRQQRSAVTGVGGGHSYATIPVTTNSPAVLVYGTGQTSGHLFRHCILAFTDLNSSNMVAACMPHTVAIPSRTLCAHTLHHRWSTRLLPALINKQFGGT